MDHGLRRTTFASKIDIAGKWVLLFILFDYLLSVSIVFLQILDHIDLQFTLFFFFYCAHRVLLSYCRTPDNTRNFKLHSLTSTLPTLRITLNNKTLGSINSEQTPSNFFLAFNE